MRKRYLSLVIRACTLFLLAATVLFIFVPLMPSMPTGLNPLDPSWVFGMNIAAAKYLAFGSELLFTYGPYASISTRTFHPFTDPLAFYGGLYLAGVYLAALIFITRNSSALWILVLITSFSFIKQYSDTLLSSYALLIGLFCYQLIQYPVKTKLGIAGLLVLTFYLFTPFGLYPLIKGSVYILYFAVAILSFGVLLYFKKWYFALSIPISLIFSLVFFWKIAGQPTLGLIDYFSSLGMIISGYSDAMSMPGNKFEIFAFLCTSILLVVVLLRRLGLNVASIYLCLIFLLYLFIGFKGGFVRHDAHAVFGISALYFSAVMLFVVLPSYQTVFTLLFATLSFVYIDGHYDNSLRVRRFAPVSETYNWGIYGVKKRLSDSGGFLGEYKKSVEQIKEEADFPVLSGTVDTYPFDQSRVIASGYDWVPRPVFQSYAAYNPELAKINHEHLLGGKAPDNIVFRVSTIDNRFPSLDDGLSWPTILKNYHLSKTRGDFLFLSKNQENITPALMCSLGSKDFSFGEPISVPQDGGLIFSQIDVRPNLLGRLMSILFKSSELRIKVELQSGRLTEYRIIPGMAKSGFILSPLIENTADFKRLITKDSLTTLGRVKTFTISPVDQLWQWNKEFTVDFKVFQFPNKPVESCPK